MANALHKDITGKIVSVGGRKFHAQDGFGCIADLMGRAVFGRFLDTNEECRIDGYDIDENVPPEDPITQKADDSEPKQSAGMRELYADMDHEATEEARQDLENFTID